MMKNTITVPEICKVLTLPETSARRIIKAYPLFFPVAAEGRPLRYRPEALEVMRFILEAQKAGTSSGEIEAGLAGRGFSREVSGTANHQPPTTNQPPLAEISRENLAEWLVVQENRQAEALDVNRRLLAAVERQNELLAALVRGQELGERQAARGFWAWVRGWWK
jgi:DNA-binding transcriptional MerR regulator